MTAAFTHSITLRLATLLKTVSLITATCLLFLPIKATFAQEAEMLWTCSSTSNGEWLCTGNDDAIKKQAVKQAAETASNTSEPASSTIAPETTNAVTEKSQPALVEPETSKIPSTQEDSTKSVTAKTATTAAITSTITSNDNDGQPTTTPDFQPSNKSIPTNTAEKDLVDSSCTDTKNPECILNIHSLSVEKPSLAELQSYPRNYPKAYATTAELALVSKSSELTNTSKKLAGSQGFEWKCRPNASGSDWNCDEDAISATRSYQSRQPQLPTQAFPYAFLDWYAYSDGKANPQNHCSGEYIQPKFEPAFAEEKEATKIYADQSRTENSNFTKLSGNVHLQQGNKHLYAQEASLDHDNELATLKGQILYREPNTLMLGQNAQFDRQNGTTELNQVEFVFHDQSMRGDAERVVQLENEDVYITGGRYTRCEPGNEDWVLSGSEIILYQQEGYGVAYNATIRVGGVPVFYLPYFTFPIDDRRKSGFLIPDVGYSNNNGVDVSAPYYFNIAPDVDDTLTPRYLSERGLMLENELRYLNTYGTYDLSLALLPNDDITGEDRWLLGVNHKGKPADNVTTYIDYTAVSDNDYFDDLSTSLSITEKTHLDKRVGINYAGDNWNAAAKLQGYQTITDADKPYQELPKLSLWGQEGIKDDQYTFSYRSEFTDFYRDNDNFTGIEATTGQRLYLESAIAADYRWSWAYVKPKAALTYTQYSLTDQPTTTESSASRILPVMSIDSGIYLDREMTFDDKKYTHTVEPRLFYLYVPYEDQSDLPYFDSSELAFSYSQLFRENRFSSKDRIGDANQITLGLTSRILEDNGAELGHISIGQIFYFDDREVRLESTDSTITDSTSNFAAEGLWQVSKNMRFTADGEWENNDFQNTQRNFKVSYRTDRDHQFSVGYRYTEDDIEQAEASIIWPLDENWSVLGRVLHDLEGQETLDSIAGLEYENCCVQVRTVFRSWVDDDTDDRKNNGIFLQLTLKGLTSVGTQAAGDNGPGANTFLDEITGFEEREVYNE